MKAQECRRFDQHNYLAHHATIGEVIMPAESTSGRVEAKVTAKSVRADATGPRIRKLRMSKLELKKLESFKALMRKYGGKGTFAGCDE
jgi:hypothetical protein